MEIFFCILLAARFSYDDIRFRSMSVCEMTLATAIAFFWKMENTPRALIFLAFALVCYFFPLGVGEGDFWLVGIWAFFFGKFFCGTLIFTAALFALLYAGGYFLRKKVYPKTIPFVPFLSIALICQVILLDEVLFAW
ncbi:hypothetical protein SAMN02745116_02217 [Pilibacter termitis]|uniref:Type IV leader peptidase family protein n=1 Tax=Pilibacter termitis TaxID=263852 RepID=A0A1T4QJQ2_9ENTE|nr:hypothetical protein [Pilibacter termitis]SKA03949.1 hypothetical protein SAMN02745116_02217 [Pilibacter termitis]